MKLSTKFIFINGSIASGLGVGIVAMVDGMNSELPPLHILCFILSVYTAYYAISRTLDTHGKLSTILWSCGVFLFLVPAFGIASNFLRFHNWVRIPEISNYEWYFLLYPQPVYVMCLALSPIFIAINGLMNFSAPNQTLKQTW